MNFFLLSPARWLPVLLAAWTGGAAAQAPLLSTDPVLTLQPAVLLSLPTEAGKVYQLQASSDLKGWEDSGSPVFGSGTPLEQAMASEGRQFFRLKVLTEPALGSSHWSLDGRSFQLNDGNGVVRYDFPAGSAGYRQAGPSGKSFTWTWQRLSMAGGIAELTFLDGSREFLDLQFSASQIGCFTRRIFADSQLVDTDSGSFGPVPAAATPLVPSSLDGRSIALCDQPGGSSLTFTSSNSGTRLLDGQPSPFEGNWLVTGIGTARFTATFSPTHGEDYRFTFTGPQTGRYLRQTFTEGIFRDEDEGTFCLGNPP